MANISMHPRTPTNKSQSTSNLVATHHIHMLTHIHARILIKHTYDQPDAQTQPYANVSTPHVPTHIHHIHHVHTTCTVLHMGPHIANLTDDLGTTSRVTKQN